MICPNCGMELDEGELVCELCGYEFAEQSAAGQPEEAKPAAEAYESEPEAPEAETEPEAEELPRQSDTAPKKGKGLIIIIAVLAAAIIALGILVVKLMSDKDAPRPSGSSEPPAAPVTDAIPEESIPSSEADTTEDTAQAPTEAPTPAPTEAPTEPLTEAPTEAPAGFESFTGYVATDSDSLNVRSAPSSDAEKIGSLPKGSAVTVTGYDMSGWYMIDFNGSTGYVSAEYISEEYTAEAETVEYITLSENGLLLMDTSLFECDYNTLCSRLGVSLPAQQDFPWWGTDLKNVDYTYNGIPLCFMFQYDQLVMVIYDVPGEFNNDICSAAYDWYGNGVDYPHCWHLQLHDCYFEITLDTAADGSSHFKQQYFSGDMIVV